MELERPVLRRLRRELRRAEALAVAGRTLARADVSAQRLGERLEKRVGRPAARDTLGRLVEAGIVDDLRVARRWARLLADRGWGDAAILARLEADGVASETGREVIAELSPEPQRAARLVADEPNARAARLLARRGFASETIEDALGPLLDGEPSEG
jgi:SOS response regulatory protein OraA/RecX